MSAQIKENVFSYPLFTATNGLINSSSDGVGRLRGWYNSLRTNELHAGFKASQLVLRYRFNQTIFQQLTYEHPGTMIAQTTSMNG